MFTKAQLTEQIREMGITARDTVLLHSSMRAIGEVENGADGVIEAFCTYLTGGLFLVPTHTWANVGPQQPLYDVKSTVPCIGALPCAAAFRTDGVRSLHPTHSVWAHGERAAAFLAGEEYAETPTPPGFVWARLAEVKAKILLAGVGNDKNTFIHAVEELAQVPDRLQPEPFEVTIRAEDGTEYRHRYAGHFCSRSADVSRQFVNFEKPLIARGAQTFGRLGNASVRIVEAALCRDVIQQIYYRADRDVCVELREIPEAWYR